MEKGPAVRGAKSKMDSGNAKETTPTPDLVGGIRATVATKTTWNPQKGHSVNGVPGHPRGSEKPGRDPALAPGPGGCAAGAGTFAPWLVGPQNEGLFF
jgi:hypothetical protein